MVRKIQSSTISKKLFKDGRLVFSCTIRSYKRISVYVHESFNGCINA